MKNINNIAGITKKFVNKLKRFADNYVPEKQASSEKEIENYADECPELNYGKYWYNQTRVDQSFMN